LANLIRRPVIDALTVEVGVHGKLRLCDPRREPANCVEMSSFRFARIGNNLAALLVKVLPETCDFVVAVDGFNKLFEGDGDEQTDDNSRNVDEKAELFWMAMTMQVRASGALTSCSMRWGNSSNSG